MLRVLGESPLDGQVDVAFADADRWESVPFAAEAGDPAQEAVKVKTLLLGDEEVGPLVWFFALPPRISPADAFPHGHASDNWRMSLLGTLPMRNEIYGAGEFRLQKGWKPYPSDNYASGPEGGWTILCFADRRGTRVRPVSQEPELLDAVAHISKVTDDWLGIGGDLLSADPADSCGESTIATSLGAFNKPRINGSFADTESWHDTGDGTRFAVTLMGDAEGGPVLIFADTEPGAVAVPVCEFGTECLRVVVSGSCTVGDRRFAHGEARLVEAGKLHEEVRAGAGGLREAVLLGDRRGAVPSPTGLTGWPGRLAQVLADLSTPVAV